MEIMAEQDVTVTSTQGKVTIAGKREILLTSGGGYIRLKDGNIDIHCPGIVSIRAKKHDWAGPTRMDVAYPQFPGSVCVECMLKARASASPVAKS
jgi:type VI secretion system secreted protein VgrG